MKSGVINVYKEEGYTSHDVVAKLRGILKEKKIGHMGTLDPNAVGVLPVYIGKATKLCGILAQKDKTYKATLLLGMVTNTQDVFGEVIKEAPKEELDALEEEQVIKVIKSFEGDYEQIPPMFSAIKIKGKKLYELARKGEEVERAPRHCKIWKITITNIDLPRIELEVTCSKGTYIRTLCHDIGETLSVGGCMEKLERTQVERFNIDDSLTLARIEYLRDEGLIEDFIIPADEVLDMYSKCIVDREADRLVYNGNIFTSGQTMLRMNHEDGQIVRVYSSSNEFIGLYEFNEQKQFYKPEKMFF